MLPQVFDNPPEADQWTTRAHPQGENFYAVLYNDRVQSVTSKIQLQPVYSSEYSYENEFA
jgi:hypothetical protein